jgi:hypothetical protein
MLEVEHSGGGTGDETDQEWRSAGRRAVPSVTVMDISIHYVGFEAAGATGGRLVAALLHDR